MHRCLEITELICLICSKLESNESTLLDVSLTSKAFLEPALSVLWRKQHWIDVLFRVLPSDLWVDQSELEEEDRFLDIRRPLLPTDLERYRFYKTMIKDVDFEDTGAMGTPTRNSYAMLRRAFDVYHPGESYLPEPTTLQFSISDDDGWHIYDMISPKLRLLRIICHPCHVSLLAMLSTLPNRAPMLKDLDISEIINEEVFGVLAFSLPSLQSLQSFQCDTTITTEVATALAALPHLIRLYCLPPGHSTSLSHHQHSSYNLFPSLRHVHLGVRQITSIARFFQTYMNTCPVKIFKATILYDDSLDLPPDGLPSTWQNLSGGLYVHWLTSFIIDCTLPMVASSTAAPPIGLRDFHPILSCGQLEVFSLQLDRSMSGFDDSSSEAMAVAWPKLRGLILASYDVRELIPTRCTMRSLSYLAHGCPDLETVAIAFSPSTAPYHVQTPNGNAVHLNLANLNVLHSPLAWSSAAGVASFLSDFFPCIQSIMIPERYTTPEDEHNLLAWREVRRLYEASGMDGRDF